MVDAVVPRKVRASSDQPEVAVARYQLFKTGFARINDAIEHRYFLEAICLIESLLADRMESRVSDHADDYNGFDALGSILRRLKHEPNASLQKLNLEVDHWRVQRNGIHEVMKIDASPLCDWNTRFRRLRATAVSGRKLLRNYDQALRRVRREEGRLSATNTAKK